MKQYKKNATVGIKACIDFGVPHKIFFFRKSLKYIYNIYMTVCDTFMVLNSAFDLKGITGLPVGVPTEAYYTRLVVNAHQSMLLLCDFEK